MTIPQVGAVGLSEEEAEDQGYAVEVGDFPYPINGLAMAQDQLTGAAKIVSDSRYGKILGVHVIGAQAVELVGQAVGTGQPTSATPAIAACTSGLP